MGKSTLLEGLADKWSFSMQSGNRSKTPGLRGYETALARAMTLTRTSARPMDGFFLRAESFYNLLAYPDSMICELDEDGIRKTEYEDTRAYQVTRRFMRDPRGMMDKLLGDG